MFGIVKTFLHRDDLFTLCKLYYCMTCACLSNGTFEHMGEYLILATSYIYTETPPPEKRKKKEEELIPQSFLISI